MKTYLLLLLTNTLLIFALLAEHHLLISAQVRDSRVMAEASAALQKQGKALTDCMAVVEGSKP